MNGKADPMTEAPEQTEPSAILIQFAAHGSMEVQVQISNISPAQLMYAAAFLTRIANKEMDKHEARQQASKILVPGLALAH